MACKLACQWIPKQDVTCSHSFCKHGFEQKRAEGKVKRTGKSMLQLWGEISLKSMQCIWNFIYNALFYSHLLFIFLIVSIKVKTFNRQTDRQKERCVHNTPAPPTQTPFRLLNKQNTARLVFKYLKCWTYTWSRKYYNLKRKYFIVVTS